MKSITEFAQPVLQKFINAKNALAAEGKTLEEIATSIGETFKLEGDKLKHMFAASDLVADKKDFRRVVVVSFAEGETAPAKFQKVDDTYYCVETLTVYQKPAPVAKGNGRGSGPRKGGNSGAPKTSPWGASPEEIEAKKKASILAAQAKKK